MSVPTNGQAPDPPQLSPQELARYHRHLILPEFGLEGQQKLKSSRVLVVGTGGLGAPLLQYLAAAGVGVIGLLDYDVVDASNLQRQVLFGTDQVGQPKVEAARDRLQKLNPEVEFILHNTQLTSENALELFQDYDVIADGTDNFPTRYLVNDACVLLGKVNVYGSIFRFEGQVSVFNYRDPNGELGPNYRDLFPEPPPPGLVPSCAEGGVLGVLPGIIGSMQALEVIKVLTGIGQPLSGTLFTLDTLSFKTRSLKVRPNPDNPLTGDNPTQTKLIDYEQFCGMPNQESGELDIASITVQDLAQWRREGRDFQLIDVREPHEYEIANLQGELIPKGELEKHVERINQSKPVVIHCKSGKRSADSIRLLQNQYGFRNLKNLEGGILAWQEYLEPSMPRY